MPGLSQLYVIREATSGSSAASRLLDLLRASGGKVVHDWAAVSRFAPEAGPTWDAESMDDWAGSSPTFLIVGSALLAFGDDGEGIAVYHSGHWLPLLIYQLRGWVAVESSLMRTRKLYLADMRRRVPQVDLVGVDPNEIEGAQSPDRPNGKVTATIKSPSIEQIGQALEALAK